MCLFSCVVLRRAMAVGSHRPGALGVSPLALLVAGVCVNVVIGVTYGGIEYYHVRELPDGYPYTKDNDVLLGHTLYHLLGMGMLFATCGVAVHAPLLLAPPCLGPGAAVRVGLLLWSVSHVFMAVTVQDCAYFVFRVARGKKDDERAGLFIQRHEWTTRWGAVNVGDNEAVPYSYFWITAGCVVLLVAGWFLVASGAGPAGRDDDMGEKEKEAAGHDVDGSHQGDGGHRVDIRTDKKETHKRADVAQGLGASLAGAAAASDDDKGGGAGR